MASSPRFRNRNLLLAELSVSWVVFLVAFAGSWSLSAAAVFSLGMISFQVDGSSMNGSLALFPNFLASLS